MTASPGRIVRVRVKREIAPLIVIRPRMNPHPESTARILPDERAR
jgi:hypothetical protein